MKLYYIVGILLFSLIGSGVSAQVVLDRSKKPIDKTSKVIDLKEYKKFELENGLKVILVEDHRKPIINFSVSIDLIPQREKELKGVSTIAGRMLSVGYLGKTKDEIDEQIDFIGATLQSGSGGVYGSCLRKNRHQLLENMSGMIEKPTFPVSHFKLIKKQMISNLKASKNDASKIVSNVGSVLLYGKEHPFGELITERSIAAISLEDCKQFNKKYFRPNIAHLVIVGDLSLKEAKSISEQYFSSWEKTNIEYESFPEIKENKGKRIVLIDKPDAIQSSIRLLHPVNLKPNNPDLLKVKALEYLYGGSFNSRLNNNLREKNAFTYGAGASFSVSKFQGKHEVSTEVRNQVTDSAMIEILQEFKSIQTTIASIDEMKRMRGAMLGKYARAMEGNSSVVSRALGIERDQMSQNYYANYLAEVEKITAEDIQLMAKEWLDLENHFFVIVGNLSEINTSIKNTFSDYQIEYRDEMGNEKEFIQLTKTDILFEEVLSNYIDARGGREKLMGITSLEKSVETLSGDNTFHSNFKIKKGKLRSEISSPNGKVLQVFDGQKGFINKGKGAEPLPIQKVIQMKQETILFPELIEEQPGASQTVAGITLVDGEEVYKVEVIRPKAPKQFDFYNKKTGLLQQSLIYHPTQRGPMLITILYQDYETKDGITYPRNVKYVINDQITQIRIKDIVFNPKLEDSIFKM